MVTCWDRMAEDREYPQNNPSQAILPNPEDLQIPTAIRKAAKMNKLAFFVGNGLSRLYGLPSWDELSSRMLGRLAAKGILSHAQTELLKRQSLKTRISIADFHFKDNLKTKKHSDLRYSEFLQPSADKRNNPAYPSLAKCNAKLITTNYDNLLEKALKGTLSGETVKNSVANDPHGQNISSIERKDPENIRIYKDPYKILKSDLLDNNVLYHVHGSTEDEAQIIASAKGYIDYYTDENTTAFLKSLFFNHCVVFIGYGLDELELLELVVRSQKGEKANPIFLLLPLYSYEAAIIDQLKIYYEDHLGIKILAFSMDKHNYEAFAKLLERWAPILEDISPRQPSRTQDLNLIDEFVGELNDTQ